MKLVNVKPEIRDLIISSQVATDLAQSMLDSFFINSYQMVNDARGQFESLYCKPSNTLASSLLVDDREILVVISNFTRVQARIVKFAAQQIAKETPRLHPSIVIVVHADPTGNTVLRHWGRERGIHVIPLFRDPQVGLPDPKGFKKLLSEDLFSLDPFDITGPVISDDDFYGRRNEAFELVRQLEKGRIRSFFGIRKIGKTSIINRAINQAVTHHDIRVAFIDCSNDNFHSLKHQDALGVLCSTIEIACGEKKYASTVEVSHISSVEETFLSLPEKLKERPLAIVFDEIDYITPGSPTCKHWREEFNPFWRILRLHIQELQRKGVKISLLVSGVSSMWFREESINGVENAALHFVPEEYLSPFPRDASKSMIKRLGRKAGLIFDDQVANYLADECADFPFWIRQAGSLVHRVIPSEDRPYHVTLEEIKEFLNEFIETEGTELVSIPLKHLSRAHPKCFKALTKLYRNEKLTRSEVFTLEKYGLVKRDNEQIVISSRLIEEALKRILEEHEEQDTEVNEAFVGKRNQSIFFDTSEWAEELAVINKRRNIIERNLREFVRFAFKFTDKTNQSWAQIVLQSLPEKRRKELGALEGTKILKELYFKDLIQIIQKHWAVFQSHFGDKSLFEHHANILNWRPDTHAKDFDALDLALQRNSLEWFEKILLR
jgi:hypothetical protein